MMSRCGKCGNRITDDGCQCVELAAKGTADALQQAVANTPEAIVLIKELRTMLVAKEGEVRAAREEIARLQGQVRGLEHMCNDKDRSGTNWMNRYDESQAKLGRAHRVLNQAHVRHAAYEAFGQEHVDAILADADSAAAGEAWRAQQKRMHDLESALRAIIGSRHDDLDTGSINWVAVLDCALEKAAALLDSKPRTAIYTASRTRHAHRWRELRAAGVPIISTWIDEAGEGESASMVDLWIRCAAEAASASAVLLYAEEGDVLKGAFVEAGAALAAGVPVFVVGPVPGSWVNHPLVTECESIEDALAKVDARRGGGKDGER